MNRETSLTAEPDGDAAPHGACPIDGADGPSALPYDEIIELAVAISGWPMASIHWLEAHASWLHVRVAPPPAMPLPGSSVLGDLALQFGDPWFEIVDAVSDPRVASTPLVLGPRGVRACVAHVLHVHGARVGALCVMNTEAGPLGGSARRALEALARLTSERLERQADARTVALERERVADVALASSDWMWETDAEARVSWLSPSFTSVTGQAACEQLGHRLADGELVDAAGRPLQPPTRLHDLLVRRRAFSRATIAWPGNGSPRWMSLSAVPSRGGEGMRGGARDVTAYVLAEQRRQGEWRRLHDVVEQLPGALFGLCRDAKGHLSFALATKGFEALFGVAANVAALDAATVFDRLDADDRRRLDDALAASAHDATPLHLTVRVRGGDGALRSCDVLAVPDREGSDGDVTWYGIAVDVTAREAQRQAHERAQRERDRALRVASARQEALTRVSHELRTPLNAILGFVQLMQEALRDRRAPATSASLPCDDAQASWSSWVEHVRAAATHLLGIVNGMLDAASVEARRVAVDLQSVDVEAAVATVLEAMRAQALQRHQRLEWVDDTGAASAADRPQVRADRRALRQVLFNLVGNACKYSPDGASITVGCRAGAAGTWVIEVCDTGPGIPEEEQARLFRRFERAASAGDTAEGTGLGLVISRRLVRAMGGKLTLRSTLGRGSVFAVALPAAGQGGAVDAAPAPSDSAFGSLPSGGPDAAPPPWPAATLLYVEDDAVNGVLMQEFVARMPPLRLHLATTVAEGLDAARSLKPDLVIVDMHLPDGTGVDVLRGLRADASTAGLRVVVLSADAMPPHVEQAKAQGFDDYWTKPVDFALLRRRLQALLPLAAPV